jgi:hypothetical protein
MAYDFYLDEELMPIPPSKMTMTINNKNKTIDLINGIEVNILKPPGLTEIDVSFSIPHRQYHYAKYLNGFKDALHFLKKFEELKLSQKPFQFIVSRIMNNSSEAFFYTNYKVSLEDYSIAEDAEDNSDITITAKLKEYRNYATIIHPADSKNNNGGTPAVKPEQERPAGENKPKGKTYTVKPNDNLYDICKAQLGNGSLYKKVYDLNKDMIDKRNTGKNVPKYTIYAGQVLRLE